jgi:hypothetical protein
MLYHLKQAKKLPKTQFAVNYKIMQGMLLFLVLLIIQFAEMKHSERIFS